MRTKTRSVKRSTDRPVKKSKNTHQRSSTQDTNNNVLTTTCLITREDKKPIAFNFYKANLSSWSALSFLKPDSLNRNQKGSVITAEVQDQKLSDLQEASKTFTHNEINYTLKIIRPLSPYMGEIIFDLTDLEDKSILQLTETDLKESLTLPSFHSSNTITNVQKIFPRKPLQAQDKLIRSTRTMRIAIECSNAIPDRTFYENVSLPVLPYIAPPTRCFGCQRYGHGALSCRRKKRCAKCGSEEHQSPECDAESPCCPSCEEPHFASSYSCRYFKAARAIAIQVQSNRMSRQEAAKRYAELYSVPIDAVPVPQFARGPLIVPSQPCMQLPSQQSQSSRSPNCVAPPEARAPARVSEQPSQRQPMAIPSTSTGRASQASQPITAGQRSQSQPVRRKRTITDSQVGLPPHLTPEYTQIVREPSYVNGDSPPSLIEYISSNNYHHNDSHNNNNDQQSESSPTVASVLKSLLSQIVDWIVTQLLPKSFRESPIIASLLKSLSDLFTKSSPF